MIKANSGEHGLVETIFEDKTGVQRFASDKEDDLGCAVVNVEGVEATFTARQYLCPYSLP